MRWLGPMLLSLVSAGCSASHAVEPADTGLSDAASRPPDAAYTSPPDAARPVDAARASLDAGAVDALALPATDGGPGVSSCPATYAPAIDCSDGDPHWQSQPGVWSYCPLERAQCPANALSFTWEPCGVGPPSCERANLADGASLAGLVVGSPDRRQGGGHDGLRGIVALSGTRWGETVGAIVSTEGHALAVWRIAGGFDCGIYQTAASARGAALFAVSLRPPLGMGDDFRIFHAPVDLASRIEGPIASGDQAIDIALSEHFVATDFDVGPDVVSACEPSQRIEDRVDPTGELSTVELAVLDPMVLWTVQSIRDGRSAIRIGARDRPARDYYVPAANRGVEGMASDGIDVAWLEHDLRGDGSTRELWTGRYVEDPASFAPRRVVELPEVPSPGVIVGGGRYFYMGGRGAASCSLVAVDLASGHVGSFESPFAPCFWGPAYATAGEVVFTSGDYLVRVDPREL